MECAQPEVVTVTIDRAAFEAQDVKCLKQDEGEAEGEATEGEAAEGEAEGEGEGSIILPCEPDAVITITSDDGETATVEVWVEDLADNCDAEGEPEEGEAAEGEAEGEEA